MEMDLAVKIIRNANREQFLDTIRLLWRQIEDYELLSKVGEELAMRELQRQHAPIVDTH